MKDDADDSPTIGWREWVALPDLGILAVKAKVDTGARSSSLHAFDVEIHLDGDTPRVRFKVHPLQRKSTRPVHAEAPLLAMRTIRTSGGHQSLRPVILTDLQLGGQRHPIELTLVNRDQMGFRMLLGRQALRNRYIVDSAQSFLTGGKPRVKKKKRKAKRRIPKPAD